MIRSLVSRLSRPAFGHLPYATSPSADRRPRSFPRALPRRHLRLLVALAICVPSLLLFLSFHTTESPRGTNLSHLWPASTESRLPPLYPEWYERQRQLPQHNPDLPYPQGKDGKYLYMANHVWGLGWGNALQEQILNAHLAYKAKAIYVFDNYTWDGYSKGEYSKYNGTIVPAYIPMTAMIAGPIAGDPFTFSENVPPAVMREYFDNTCKNKTVINPDEINGQLSRASAATIVQAWVDKINSIDDNCIEIKWETNQIFDFWLFGEANRLLDIWPSLSRSPILTEFQWSPLVIDAVETNGALIHPSIKPGLVSRDRLPGLLALHIRRGDFEQHCGLLAGYRSRFQGFNEMPEFIDRFEPAPPTEDGTISPQERARVLKRCFPDIDQIVEKVVAVRNSPAGRGLDRVYVLTNGKREWLDELCAALRKAARWKSVATSRDLTLTWEQKYVAQAADMLIAERADVFVGNGFSSLTSNVVMLRQSKGFPADHIRFW